MKAMILAAGRGERMRPLTDHTPKPLLSVGGKPLIVWHIIKLAEAGFCELVINHAHLGHQIERVLGNGSQWGVSIRYSPEKTALETAGGIANALPLLGEEPFMVINGDIFCEFNLAGINPPRGNDLAWLLLVNNPPHHPNGDFSLSHERVAEQGAVMYTYSGIGVYRPEFFVKLERGRKAKLAPLLRSAIASDRVGGSLYGGRWMDIGTPQRLQELNQQLHMTRHKST